MGNRIFTKWGREIDPEHVLEENLEKGLSASVYTQLSDVEDETNGLMTYDREILKVDGETLRELNVRLQEAFEHICS